MADKVQKVRARTTKTAKPKPPAKPPAKPTAKSAPKVPAKTQSTTEDSRRAAALAALVQLEQRVRGTRDTIELDFRIVNETTLLVPYRQASLFRRSLPGQAGGQLKAISNVPVIDKQGPLTLWLDKLHRHYDQAADANVSPVSFSADDMPRDIAKDWAEWQPAHALWLPLIARDRAAYMGGLLLFRDQPFSEAEQRILAILTDAYGYSLATLVGAGRKASSLTHTRWYHDRRKLSLAIAVAVFVVMLLPVRLSVLADAEVIPSDPYHIRAPLEGVLDQALVEPGARVTAGQPLIAYDQRDLRNQLALGEKELNVAQTELQRISQAAVTDPRAKAQLAILTAQRDEKATEVEFLRELLSRTAITAPIDGVAIFEDADSLAGRPVQLGQRLMTVAVPDAVDLELWLGTSDAIPLTVGAPVTLFLNVEPERPIEATLSRTGLLAELRDDANQAAYRLKASFDADMTAAERPALGLRGVAKLEGERVTLFYYLFRRPLSIMRQWLGI